MADCLTLIVMLVVLGAIGWVIDLIIPGKMPYGWLGGVGAAIIGGLLGALLLGSFGPAVRAFGWQLSIIPALLGGIILAVIVRFIMGMQRRNV
jgi:uncharacterized membrane protein YeaQ/YmgE (transglycosylase-associated protein family)